jgi:hypothetical protein
VSYLSFATRRTFRILVYISILLVAIFSTTLILVIALQCPSNPLFALSPEMFLPHSQIYCRDLRAVFYWQSAFNMASDCVILVLPMPLLFRLRMHRTKRMSLIAVFSVGLLVPIASGVRLWGLYLWAHSGTMARYYGGYIIFWFVGYKPCDGEVLIVHLGPRSKSIRQSYAHRRRRCNRCLNSRLINYRCVSAQETRAITMVASGIHRVCDPVRTSAKSDLWSGTLFVNWRHRR